MLPMITKKILMFNCQINLKNKPLNSLSMSIIIIIIILQATLELKVI